MNTSRAALIVTLCLVASGYPDAQYGPRAPLFVAVSIDEYIAETYTERPFPPSRLVYFTSESIQHLVRAANEQPPELTVDFPTGVDRAVKVTHAVKVDPATGAETPLTLSLRVDSVTKLAGGIHPVPVTDTDAIAFEYKDQVEWRFHLRQRLEAGHYRVSIGFLGKDREGRRIHPMTEEMSFEVRNASRYRAEVLVREAYRNIRPDRAVGRAENALKRLFAINPNSTVGYDLLALVADLRGDAALARRHRATSAEIFKAGQDQLLLKYCDPACIARRRSAHY